MPTPSTTTTTTDLTDLSQISNAALESQIPTLGSGSGDDLVIVEEKDMLVRNPEDKTNDGSESNNDDGDDGSSSSSTNELLPSATEQQQQQHQEKMDETQQNPKLAEVLALAIPALGSIVADPLMSLVDTGCVGQVSSIHLASLGPNTAIFNFIFQVFAFIGVATTNVVATNSPTAPDLSDEERDDRRRFCERFVCYAVQCAVYAGIAMCVLLQVSGPWLLSLLGADGAMAEPPLAYLRIRALASPAVMALCVCQGASLGMQDSLTPLRIFAFAGVANLLGDWMLTLGLGMGAAGAAWATLAAQITGLAIFFATLRRKNAKGLRLVWRGFPRFSVLKPFMVVATTLISRTLFTMVAFTMTSYAATSMGLQITAAHQVVLQVFWFLTFFPEPLSVAAQSLIARDIGAASTASSSDAAYAANHAKPLARLLLKLGVVFGILLSVATGVILTQLPFLFTTDAAVTSLVASAAPIASTTVLVVAVVMVCDGISIGSNDFKHLPRTNLVATMVAAAILFGTSTTGCGLCRVWMSMFAFFVVRFAQHLLHAVSHRRDSVLAKAMGMAA